MEIEPALDDTREASVSQVFVRKTAAVSPAHVWPHHLSVATAHLNAMVRIILLMLRRILDNLRRRSLTWTTAKDRPGNGLEGLVRSLVFGTQPLVTRAQVPPTKPAEDVRVQGGSPGFVTKALRGGEASTRRR